MLILFIVAGSWIGGLVGSVAKSVGPVTPQTVQQNLGPEVPVYPKGTLNVPGTQGALIAVRASEKAAGKPAGSLVRGMAVMETQDDAQTVFAYYDPILRSAGWQAGQPSNTGTRQQQRTYSKGGEVVVIQVQPAGTGGNQLMIMRGGPGMPSSAPSGGSPGGR